MQFSNRYVTHEQLWHTAARIYERMDQMEASQQGQIDAIVAELATVQTDLDSARTTLQAEIDALAVGTPVTPANLEALQSAVDRLDPAVQALAGLKPTPPAAG